MSLQEQIDTPSLFVYGTLMSKSRVLGLIKRIPKNLPGKLPDFHNYQLQGVKYPGAKPLKGSFINGIVFFNLTEKEMKILDQYEGDEYQKEYVVISNQYRVLVYSYIGRLRTFGEWKFEDHFPENDRIKSDTI